MLTALTFCTKASDLTEEISEVLDCCAVIACRLIFVSPCDGDMDDKAVAPFTSGVHLVKFCIRYGVVCCGGWVIVGPILICGPWKLVWVHTALHFQRNNLGNMCKTDTTEQAVLH